MFAILVAAGICCMGGMFMMSSVLKQSKQVQEAALKFCQQDVEPIFKTWDVEMLKKISHPELIKHTPATEMKTAFAKMSAKLGPLKEVTGWRNKGFNTKNKVDGVEMPAVSIAGDAIFLRGKATINLKTHSTGGQVDAGRSAGESDRKLRKKRLVYRVHLL